MFCKGGGLVQQEGELHLAIYGMKLPWRMGSVETVGSWLVTNRSIYVYICLPDCLIYLSVYPYTSMHRSIYLYLSMSFYLSVCVYLLIEAAMNNESCRFVSGCLGGSLFSWRRRWRSRRAIEFPPRMPSSWKRHVWPSCIMC